MRRILLTLFVLGASAIVWFGIPAEAAVDIVINKRAQSMSVSVDGAVLYHWPVSTGRSGYATPSGKFGVTRTERVYFSKKYDNAPMPNAIFFTNRGHAIHGTYESKRLGSAVSHGCVRLDRQNAATLFRLVKTEGIENTRISIVGSPAAKRAKAPSPQPQGFRVPPHIEPEWTPDGGYFEELPPWFEDQYWDGPSQYGDQWE